MELKVEDFGNGFRAFCHGTRSNAGGIRTYYIGAIVSNAHALSQVPYFIASAVGGFVDKAGNQLYRAELLGTLLNGDEEYGSRAEFIIWDADFYRKKLGLKDDEFLWCRKVSAYDFDDAICGFWHAIEAEAKALATITRDEILEQAFDTLTCLSVETKPLGGNDIDWLAFFREVAKESADVIAGKDAEIAALRARLEGQG